MSTRRPKSLYQEAFARLKTTADAPLPERLRLLDWLAENFPEFEIEYKITFSTVEIPRGGLCQPPSCLLLSRTPLLR